MIAKYRHSVKAVREQFKNNGVFYTPPELAEMMKSFLPQDIDEIYDPTCGNGNLLSAFGDNVKKYGQDIDYEQIEQARERLVNFTGISGDTLKEPAFWGRKFKNIIANPPFSIKWDGKLDERFEAAPCLPPNGKADYAFILHCLYYLSEDGTAVIMNFPGILYRGQREGKIRQWLIEQNYIDSVIHIPPNKFEDTSIATCILILKKQRNTTDVLFINQEIDKTRKVKHKEIVDNGYNLSVSLYVAEEEKKEIIDPIKLEREAHQNLVNRLRTELEFSKFVCNEEGMNFAALLEELGKVINEFMDGIK